MARSLVIVESPAKAKTINKYLVTLRVRHERDILQWVLGWGSHIRVLEPESLRLLVAHEATQIVTNHR